MTGSKKMPVSDGPTEDGTSQKQVDLVVGAAMKAGSDAVKNGDLVAAEEIFGNLINTDPKNAEIQNALGVVLATKGDQRGAEKYFHSASKLDPNNSIYCKNLGSIHFSQGRYSRAIRELEKAIKLDPDDMEAQYKLALVKGARGKLADYEAGLRSVIKVQPDHFEANNDLGCHLITSHQFEEAAEYLRTACESPHAVGPTFANLGNACVLLGRLTDAKIAFTKAIDLAPDNPDCLMGLAVVERDLGELEHALSHIERALSLVPDSAQLNNTHGTIQRELGSFSEARGSFEKAIELDGGLAAANVNRGLLRLLQGDWKGGFSDLESRWKDPGYATLPTDFRRNIWDGSDISDRTIVLFDEQRFGDTIQFYRFSKNIADMGGRVIVQVRPELVDLLSGAFPSVTVISRNQKTPDADFFAPLMSLPHLLNVASEADISPKPYLTAPQLSPKGRELLGIGAGIKVGLNWSGTPEHKEDYKRSIGPKMFSRIENTEGIEWINLHYGNRDDQPEIFRNSSNLSDFAGDFAESAAIINELDLVVSVDTSTVHLAGALGKPCWALIPFVPDWRWQSDRHDSPWYESVRLFRQPERNDWGRVIEDISEALSELREHGSQT